MSINKGTFHKIWSRLCLVWSSAMQKERISFGEMHVVREFGREPDKAKQVGPQNGERER